MAQNKTQATTRSVDDFIASVDSDGRRRDAETLVEMMRRVTGAEPVMWGPSIIGFGCYTYRHDSGRSGQAPIAAFSPRKASLVVYLAPGFAEREPLRARLGQHSVGKSCLYLKGLADVDQAVLEEMISLSTDGTRYRDTVS